jgi:DNA helicase-2/ATP-dependent DNA helicase PcrA
VDAIDGPVLVVAGPGSGKTELLALRVVNILKQTGLSGSAILCLTFTESGAISMRNRLISFLGKDAYKIGVFTYHGFATHIINRFPEYFYNAVSFVPATELVTSNIFQDIFKDLPHSHPFSSYHSKRGYSFLEDAKSRISQIKRSGYTAEKYRTNVDKLLKEAKEIDTVLKNYPDGRMGVKRLPEVETLVKSFLNLKSLTGTLFGETLRAAITDAESAGTVEALTSWKSKYTEKDGDNIISKDTHNKEKILALCDIYDLYEKKLYDLAMFDYDDMILQVGETLKKEENLRALLQEEYQYILLDEFQDTNEAQMNIVQSLTDSYVHEGKPNVLAVGDDDQAIYKFQGALVSHINHFRTKLYKDVKTIVLDTNYRSTQNVIDISRNVIVQGKDRLENHFEDIKKILKQGNEKLPKGEIHIHTYPNIESEYEHVANTINTLIKKGVDVKEIAVITKKHDDLKAILPYLDHYTIPYTYEKKANVFDEVHVAQLITICEYITSVLDDTATKDALLPRILSYSFLNITGEALMSISVHAKKKNISWEASVAESSDKHIQNAYALLLELVKEAPTMPLAHLLDTFIEKSGFKTYYFGEDVLKDNEAKYITFLTSLRTFMDALREYKDGEVLLACDVALFVQLHKEHKIPLIATTVLSTHTETISLLSAHKSKGLEFDYVFIISADDDTWIGRGRTNIAPLPLYMAPFIVPAGDTEDDKLRLLYVAMTRAKHSLYISSHKMLVRFLENEHEYKKEIPDALDLNVHTSTLSLPLVLHTPYARAEHSLLKELVKDYVMPITHVQNFTNLASGGPFYFVEQNLLRFPKPLIPSGAYGNAVHDAIEEIVKYKKYNGGENPTLEHVLATFVRKLASLRLPQTDFLFFKKKGEETLARYYKTQKDMFTGTEAVELDMQKEGVVVGNAILAGKIDFMKEDKDGYHVLDFKTGKGCLEWKGKDDVEKIKLHNYRYQLLMYKLLLEESIHYKKKVVSLGLQFVDDEEIMTLYLDEQQGEMERFKKLLSAIYAKIISCDFPDISKYPQTLEGVLQFEEDLIRGQK